MATVLSQILDRLDAILVANVPVGTKVFRDRTDAQSLEEGQSVNVLAHDDGAEPFSAEMDRHEVAVELRFCVRNDAAPTLVAEVIHGAVHAPIVNDATLKALCESRRLVQGAFERDEADQTVLFKSARYRFIYLIPQNTL